jgi:hypothetical protein
MLVERFDLSRLQPDSRVAVLNTLQIGDSLFFAEHKEAHSMRALSYYFYAHVTLDGVSRSGRLIRAGALFECSSKAPTLAPS